MIPSRNTLTSRARRARPSDAKVSSATQEPRYGRKIPKLNAIFSVRAKPARGGSPIGRMGDGGGRGLPFRQPQAPLAAAAEPAGEARGVRGLPGGARGRAPHSERTPPGVRVPASPHGERVPAQRSPEPRRGRKGPPLGLHRALRRRHPDRRNAPQTRTPRTQVWRHTARNARESDDERMETAKQVKQQRRPRRPHARETTRAQLPPGTKPEVEPGRERRGGCQRRWGKSPQGTGRAGWAQGCGKQPREPLRGRMGPTRFTRRRDGRAGGTANLGSGARFRVALP